MDNRAEIQQRFESSLETINIVLQFMEMSITKRARSRSLVLYLLRQVMMGFVLYIVWRTAKPLKVGEWWAGPEELLFGPARIFREYAYMKLPRILLILSCYLFAIDGLWEL